MVKLPLHKLLSLIALLPLACAQQQDVSTFKKWQPLTLSFSGPETSEFDRTNPFLNYRLNVTFENGDTRYVVPGFYAADGDASETGAETGNKWQVRFVPDQEGTWTYTVSFRTGEDIAVNDSASAGKAVFFDGQIGQFQVEPAEPGAPGFLRKGKLRNTGNRYLQFAETGEFFLKGGADSPENFLAYHEFDQTPASHKYEPHAQDWQAGDPTWRGTQGKNIIGALNYLAAKKMNVVYMLTMNVLGDGDDVWPWTDRNERYRFDCSKLDQWEIVFSHMDRLGIMPHFVLQETENECLLDTGHLDVQRKLYYRELIARFSHHLAITWNLGEENGPTNWSPIGQTDDDRKAMAEYIKKTDPYANFLAIHTHSAQQDRDKYMLPLLGNEFIDGPSLQIGDPSGVHAETIRWLNLSAETPKRWVVCCDEIGHHTRGAMPDAVDARHDTIRYEVLWGNLMAGGGGVEWYFGYQYAHADLNCEDWRSRDKLWDQTRFAIEFFSTYLPFSEMHSQDALVARQDSYCFAKKGEIYAIYLKNGGTTSLRLHETGPFNVEWYDPRNGGTLKKGSYETIRGPGLIGVGQPPEEATEDWVALVRKGS
jgi:hypothetical protein